MSETVPEINGKLDNCEFAIGFVIYAVGLDTSNVNVCGVRSGSTLPAKSVACILTAYTNPSCSVGCVELHTFGFEKLIALKISPAELNVELRTFQ